MEKGLIWYWLWLKIYFRRKAFLLQLAGMAVLLAVIASVSIPDGRNVAVGICCGSSGSAEQIARRLAEGDSVFDFRRYHDREELYQAVVSGRIECGFVFEENFEEGMREGNITRSITYLSTPLTVKGEVAKETLYSELLRSYSDVILREGEKEIYGSADHARTEELIGLNHSYQEGGEVFQLEIKTLEAKAAGEEARAAVYPIQGMAGFLVFLSMFLACGRSFEPQGRAVEKALGGAGRLLYGYVGNVAAGTFPAVAGIIMIFLLTDTRGALKEILLMLALVLISGIWVTVFGRLVRTGTAFMAAVVVVAAAHLLVCPVFLDWGSYVPAVRYVSFLFPLGIYLGI